MSQVMLTEREGSSSDPSGVELDEALEPAIAVNSPVTVNANMTVRQIEGEFWKGAHELHFSATPPAAGSLLYVLDANAD